MVSGVSSQQYDSTQSVQEHRKHHGKPPSSSDMFNDLSNLVNGSASASASSTSSASSSSSSDSGITKDQLETALTAAQKSGNTQETKMLTGAIKNFDKLSGGTDSITESSLSSALSSMKPPNTSSAGVSGSPFGEIQDPSTVTQEQLQSPIDISV